MKWVCFSLFVDKDLLNPTFGPFFTFIFHIYRFYPLAISTLQLLTFIRQIDLLFQ